MTRLGIAAGANPLTFAGLAGMGDLIATCGSHAVAQPPARRGAGEGPLLGRDRGDAAGHRPRAPTRSRPRSALAERLGVEMPIAREVERALFEGKSVQRCLVDLLARESKDELADYGRWLARLEGARRPARLSGVGRSGARLRVRRGVAQSGSAPVWGTGGRRFKSGRPDQFPRSNEHSEAGVCPRLVATMVATDAGNGVHWRTH